MPNVDVQEIANKLNLPVEDVRKSKAIQNAYYQIKNDPSISEGERQNMFHEMVEIYKNMTGKV